MQKNRIAWIDTARGISIALVVLGHTILPHPWLVYVFSFHMPLFFFLSGYLFNPQRHPDWWQFLKKKALTLLLPYLIFYLLNYIYWILRFNPQDYWEPIRTMLVSTDAIHAPFIPLWFLTCLFVLEIYFYFLQKFLPSFYLLIAVLASTALGIYLSAIKHLALPWGIDIALAVTIFYYAGFTIKQKLDFPTKLNLNWLIPITAATLGLNFYLARLHNYQVSLFYRGYGNIALFLIAAFAGTIGYLLLARILKETVFAKINIWEFLGKNTLIILGAHTVFYYFVSDFFHWQLNIYPRTSTFFAFIFTTCTLFILWPLIYLVNTRFPFILGRPKPKLQPESL